MTRAHIPVLVLMAALTLGWATDLLFYGQSLGISMPVFVLLLLVAFLILGRIARVRAVRPNLWLLLPIFFFAAMVAVRDNATLTLLNVAAVLVLLGLLAFFYAADHVEQLGLVGYPAVLGVVLKHVLTAQAPTVAAVGRTARQRGRMRMVAPLLRGMLVAAPVLLLFTILLASADTIFADYVGRVFRFEVLRDLPELLWRLALILTAAWLIAGGLFFALSRQAQPVRDDAQPALPGTLRREFSLGFVEAVIVLSLVDVLFLAFAWVQFVYLFSGEALRTLGYLEYREYVRGGFGQLLAVAVLTMALILGLRAIAWKETRGEARVLNVLCTIMIGLALVLLVSAFLRMLVWESVQFYVNTPLRIYVRWFIIWLGLTFGWLFYTLWSRPRRFAIGGFLAALGFLVTLNAVNPDADVAAYNLARQDELSTRFLWVLSDDAVPVLVAGLDHSTAAVQVGLREHLGERLAQMESDKSWQTLPAFHVAREQAYELLTGLRAAGKLAVPSAGRSP